MKKLIAALLLLPMNVLGASRVYDSNVKTLQVVVNQDWLSPPVMRLRGDVLNIGFDELSHDYHRYVYRLEHCEFDWSTSDNIFESDWLDGFNNNPIEDYEPSLNTTVLYTHYQFQVPNERCRLTKSGNYRLHITDEDTDEEIICVEFRVVEPLMNVGLSATTNTDLEMNGRYQQVAMTVNYNSLKVTNPNEQIRTVVMQNAREDNMKVNVRPNYITPQAMKWEHNQQLIFEAGNEYHKFEVLDVSHATMGLDRIVWDGQNYQAYPFVDTPRNNYLYDEDANGAFYIRNSDNLENDRTCDYVYVNYQLQARHYENAKIMVSGVWTNGSADDYEMAYDETSHSYWARILQKQGYYSYQYLMTDWDGTAHLVPEEGSFFETENTYQALVYYKGISDRFWRLTGYQQIKLK